MLPILYNALILGIDIALVKLITNHKTENHVP